MKKTICLIIGALATISTAFAQFTSDNIAVYRFGDGSTLVNGGRVPVFIDEYNPLTGEKVRTITVSRANVGSNYGIEGLGLTGGGAYETEGFPALSRDGEILSIIGRHPTNSAQFVIGTLNPAGTFSSNTLVIDGIGAPRSAVVEGNAVYYNGYQNGVMYKTLGTATAGTRVSSGQAAPRVLSIAETILGNNEGLRIFAPIGGTTTQLANASPLPTTSVNFSTAPNFPGAAMPFNVHHAVAIKAYGRTIVYVLDDGNASGSAPVIRKYRSNSGGSDWLTLGSVSVPATTKNLAVKFDAAGAKLYFTTLGTPGTQNSSIYRLNDDFATALASESKQLSGTPVLIATAPANTSFRGVTLAPGYLKAPSTLQANVISLTEVRLNWLDNSTTESGYEVERSTDGVNYSLLTTTAQNAVQYIDNTITAGTTYYYRVRGVEGAARTIYTNPANAELGAGMITNLNFAALTVYEGRPVGTEVGTFSVTPTNTTVATYTLVAGNDSADNAKFRIVGDKLQNNVLLDFEAQASYQVRVRATSSSNFIFEKSFTITINDVNEAPTIDLVTEKVVCEGIEEHVIALTGITSGPEAGQTLTATVSVNQPALFQSLQINLLGGGNGEIRYRLNANAAGEPEISITLKDNGGTANGGVDTYETKFVLKVFAYPTVAISSDRGNNVDKGLAVRLTASGGTSYQWESNPSIVGSTNTAEITVRPSVKTTYKVTVSNAGGCTSTAEFIIDVNDNYNIVTAANLVSPNGDGVNDFWIIKNIDMYPQSSVRVFDRAGRVIFDKKGYQNDWDARVGGASLKADTYYYIIDFGSGLPKKKGSLTIMNN